MSIVLKLPAGKGYILNSGEAMAETSNTMYSFVPKQIKNEPLSEDDNEVSCRLCSKVFASEIALRNHVRISHIEAYENGDPTVWTKEIKVEPASPKQEVYPEVVTNQIISSMKPTLVTSLASNDVNYLILKSDEVVVKKKVEKEVKKPPKRPKAVQVIIGPFECLESSATGADGACHQLFFSCCEYSAHVRAEHARRRRAARCQVCERLLRAAPPHCKTCGAGFDSAAELAEHAASHVKVKKYECGVCHKRFTQQGGVQQHMRMHTGARPYACSACPKAFTQKSGLDQHTRTHTKVKPFRCVVCRKQFCQSVHLKQHMRTHTNLAPFQCGVCDKRFKQSSHLNYHLRNHNPAAMRDSCAGEQRAEGGDEPGEMLAGYGDQ